jgi:hypothetical protein
MDLNQRNPIPKYPAPWWNEKHLAVVFLIALVASGCQFGWT